MSSHEWAIVSEKVSQSSKEIQAGALQQLFPSVDASELRYL